MAEILFKAEAYKIIGVCLEVYNTLGYGFQEIEFTDRQLPFIREAGILVDYKGTILKHSFCTDFLLFEQIIVEIKVNKDGIDDLATEQTLNYLKASGMKLGLIINFGRTSLNYKRLIY